MAIASSYREASCQVRQRARSSPLVAIGGKPGTLGGPLPLRQRKERATVGPYAPNLLGYTRVTMVGTMGCNPERGSQAPKPDLSPDRGLKLALVKVESLVIARHYRAVNVSLLLAHTARQATRVGFR